MFVTAILLAAGKGKRLGSRVSKPLVKLNGRPVIDYSLEVLSRHPLVDKIILAVSAGNNKSLQELVKKKRYSKVAAFVLGGARRQDSVYNVLKTVGPGPGLILIHDSARPFFNGRQVSELIARAGASGAAILGVPVKATVKQVIRRRRTRLPDGQAGKVTGFEVKKTIDRSDLWEIQTPQVFKRELILEAYRKFSRFDVTDDAGLLEKLGARVDLVPGSYGNIKITTPEDLLIAEALLKAGQP